MNIIYVNSTKKNLLTIVYTGLIISLIVMIFDLNLSIKIFNTVGIFSAISVFFLIKKEDIKISNIIVPLSVIALAIINLIWVQLYRSENSNILGLYYSYNNTMKVLFLGSFIILFTMINTQKEGISKKLAILIYTIPVILIAYYYHGISKPSGRFIISDNVATSSAYILSFMGILLSQISLLNNGIKKLPLYFIYHAIFFTLILSTETRIAILAYPILNIITLLPFIIKDKKINYKLIFTFIMITFFSLMLCNKMLTSRTDDLLSDLQKYNQKDSNSSVGARFAMYESGIHSFLNAPMGQSAESRNSNIQEQVEENPSLAGALPHISIHLHNELIESLSLKGIIGAIALLFFYYSLLHISFFVIKNNAVISLSLSIMIYGLSDVILYGKSTTIIWIIVFCLSITLVQRKNRNRTKMNPVIPNSSKYTFKRDHREYIS